MVGLDSVAKIKKLVFDSVFKRASDIASSDSLLGISFEGDELETCNAECIGSSSTDVYKLHVNVVEDKAVGKCSCPASAKAKDGLCKHVIALLLRRNYELQGKSANSARACKQEAYLDMYPVENIGSPEQEAEASRTQTRDLTTLKDGSDLVTTRPAPKQPSSKRALPAWVLGVVGSEESGESTKALKSKRKVNAEKPPRAPPPPRKRARIHGRPLKVSIDPDEEEGPGEIDVAEPVGEPLEEEIEEPVVEDGDDFDELVSGKKTGHIRKPMRPRSRHEIQLLKQRTGEIESNKGDENVGSRKGKSYPQRKSKSRRVVGKLLEVESDLSENEKSPSFARNGGGDLEDVTDDDLMLLAQEHVAKEIYTLHQNPKLENQSIIASEQKKSVEERTPVKRTSKFSLDNWKEISSQVDPGAPQSIADSLDLETLKTYSHQMDSESTLQHLEEPYSQGAGVEAFPSLQIRSTAEGERMTPPDADKDSIANDMLGLIFGSSLSTSIALPTPVHSEETSSDIGWRHSNGAENFRPLEPSLQELPSVSSAPVFPATVKNTQNLSVEFKPKKKSSLKDKIKMLLD